MKSGWKFMLAGICWMAAAQGATLQNVVLPQSSIRFVSHQMGVAVPGHFARFTARVHFDPAAAHNGMASIAVDTASADAGGNEVDATLRSSQWFDSQHWPQATFVSTALTALGGARYQASGLLTIKGKSHPVTVPFVLENMPGGLTALNGTIAISRAQWGIGAGEWADPSVVADVVQVQFHIVVKP